MADRLGEILVQKGACSVDDVRSALQNQAVYGGRLGTNLLELGLVTEDVLAAALGQRTGAPALYGNLPPDPKAVRLVDRRLAERWDVVPYLLAGRKLAVLARDPGDLQMLDEVAFVTSKSVTAFVVPEARLWRTLVRTYGSDREHRGLGAGRRSEGTTPVHQGGPAGAAGGKPAAPPPPGDLIDEADFQDLYGRIAAAAGVQGAPTPMPGALAAPAWTPPPEPSPPGAPASAAAADEAEVPPLTLEVLQALSGRVADHRPPASLEPQALLQPRPAGPGAEPSPLGFAEAVRFLEGVEERGAIARTVLRYTRSRFERAVLFTVHATEVHGWAGLGGGLTPEAVHAIRLPLGSPGVVETVVSSRAPYVGPLPKTWSNLRLLKGLGGGVPRSALLVPVLALGKVVNVLYADAGRGREVEAGDLGELLILATRIAKTYDHLAGRAV